MKVKKGEYVTRKSYGNDIVFGVDRIINLKDGNALAILKGVTFRVEADAPLQDIEKVDESRVINSKKEIDTNKKRLKAKTFNLFFSYEKGSVIHG